MYYLPLPYPHPVFQTRGNCIPRARPGYQTRLSRMCRVTAPRRVFTVRAFPCEWQWQLCIRRPPDGQRFHPFRRKGRSIRSDKPMPGQGPGQGRNAKRGEVHGRLGNGQLGSNDGSRSVPMAVGIGAGTSARTTSAIQRFLFWYILPSSGFYISYQAKCNTFCEQLFLIERAPFLSVSLLQRASPMANKEMKQANPIWRIKWRVLSTPLFARVH
jgi:hypothetical protein